MSKIIYLKDLQLIELAFLSLNESVLSNHKITFLIRVFDELIECNSVKLTNSRASDYLDWQKLFNMTKTAVNSHSFDHSISKLFTEPEILIDFLCSNLTDIAISQKLDLLPSHLYNPNFPNLELNYPILNISKDEPIQFLSLKISEKEN